MSSFPFVTTSILLSLLIERVIEYERKAAKGNFLEKLWEEYRVRLRGAFKTDLYFWKIFRFLEDFLIFWRIFRFLEHFLIFGRFLDNPRTCDI